MNNGFQIRFGVMGGTMFSALFNIHLHDVILTGAMATIGAVVSFIVSYVLKLVFSKQDKN